MSRGGRGGGRGGRGGGGAQFVVPSHSDMTKQQWQDAMREAPKHAGMLFPPLDPKSLATISCPDTLEDNLLALSHELSRHIQHGSSQLATSSSTPWRITGERKVVGIEIETWSGSHLSQSSGTQSNRLDPDALYLKKAYFPPSLWGVVFEGKVNDEAAKRKRDEKSRAKRKKRLDEPGENDEADGSDDEDKSNPSGSEDEQADFDTEDEAEDHQDYDANYFDNGEGDDDDEGGGGDDGGDGGAWD